MSDEILIQSVDDFVVHTIPALISSPSSTQLINIWVNYEHHIADTGHARKLWESIIKTLLASSLVETKDAILVYLLESLKPLKGRIAPYGPLEDYALQKADVIFNKADNKDWDVIVASLSSEGALSK
jgi:hypothetical protein